MSLSFASFYFLCQKFFSASNSTLFIVLQLPLSKNHKFNLLQNAVFTNFYRWCMAYSYSVFFQLRNVVTTCFDQLPGMLLGNILDFWELIGSSWRLLWTNCSSSCMKHILECRLLLLNDLAFSCCFTVYPCRILLCPLVAEWLVHLLPIVVAYKTGDHLVISLWSPMELCHVVSVIRSYLVYWHWVSK